MAGGAVRIVQDTCGPFTDVSPPYCPFVLEMYYLGITAGTSTTTFSPDQPITRGQAAVFVSGGVNQAIARSSRRAALGQWWTTQGPQNLALTALDTYPHSCAADGADIWVAMNGTVSRVSGSDGKLLETWTNTLGGSGILVAMGRVFVTGDGAPGQNTGGLFMIDPRQPAGDATEVAANLGGVPLGITFDGASIWTANYGDRSVSIVTPGAAPPWAVTTVTEGFSQPEGIVFDGTNIWVSDFGAGTLLRLDGNGGILQTVPVGTHPFFPVFDGANIWVPINESSTVVVVQAASGAIVATLTGNGLSSPYAAAFDGQRVLITNQVPQPSVSVWKAADLTPLGTFSTGPGTFLWGACSDGLSFWIASGYPGYGSGQLVRF